MTTRVARWLAPCLLVCCSFQAHSMPVFPGAVGYGTDTVAGRDAAVADIYEVTTLADDSYSNPTPGTLRYGIEKIARPRIIVFKVSGVIELKRDLMVRVNDTAGNHGFLTIAGHTAPFPGITLKNGGIRIMSRDVLLQHIAIRPGNNEDPSSQDDPGNAWDLSPLDNRDCVRIEGSSPSNIVVDHVTCSWTTDEAASVWAGSGTAASNITFSNNIFAHPIQFAGHTKGQHGYGPLAGVGAEKVSYIRNVMAFNWERNPLIRDKTKGAQVVNNFIYRPGPGAHRAITVGTYAGFDTPDNPNDDYPNYAASVSAIGNVIVRAPTVVWHGVTQNGASRGFYISANATTALTLHLSGNYSYDAQNGVWHPSGGQYTSPFYEAGRAPAVISPTDPHANSGGTVWEPLSGTHEFLRWRIIRGAGKSPAQRDAIDTSLASSMNDPNDPSTWLEYFEDLGANPWNAVDIHNPNIFQLPNDPTGDADGDGYKNIEEELHRLAAIAEGRGTDGSSAVSDTFSDGNANGWTTNVSGATGSWSIVNSALKQTDNTLNARAVLSGTDFDDQVVQARVTIESFSGGGFAAVYGRFNAFDHTYYMTLRSNRLLELKRVKPNGAPSGGITTYDTFQLPATFDLNAPHALRLEIYGNTLKGYVDGTLYVDGTDSENGILYGRAAVGSYLAAVSFDDVFGSRFTNAAPYLTDDFDDGTIGSWVTSGSGLGGSWSVIADPVGSTNRVLSQSQNTGNARAIWTSSATDQSTQARVKIANFGGNGFVAVYARYTDLNSAYYVTLRSTRILELKKITASGVQTIDQVQLPSTLPLNSWHTLKLDVSGGATTKLRAYLDGELKLSGTDTSSPLLSGNGAVGMYLAAAAFDDVVLTAP